MQFPLRPLRITSTYFVMNMRSKDSVSGKAMEKPLLACFVFVYFRVFSFGYVPCLVTTVVVRLGQCYVVEFRSVCDVPRMVLFGINSDFF